RAHQGDPAAVPRFAGESPGDRSSAAPRVRRVDAGHYPAPPDRYGRHDGLVERCRVPAAANLPRSSPARPDARPTAESDPRPGHRAVRPLDRSPGQPIAAAIARWRTRAALHQDCPQRRLCLRRAGRSQEGRAVSARSARFRWTWWPRSLFGRIALVLFCGLAAAHILTLALLLRERSETMGAMMMA